MNTTLENLPESFREKSIKDFAYNIVKYQNFMTIKALKKFDFPYGKLTAINYFDYGIKYIKSGTSFKNNYNTNLLKYIKEAIDNHTQPLTPKENEKRRIYNKKNDYTKKENIPSVAKIDVVKAPLTAKINYGVQINDNIVVCKTIDEAKGFLRGMKFLSSNDNVGKVVALEINEVEE